MSQDNLIWNPFRNGYRENPHPHLRLLRERNPVHKGISGRWMLFKYEDVKFMFASPQIKTYKFHEKISAKNRFLNESQNFNNISSASAKWLLFLDPPEHTALRSLVVKIWNTYKVTQFIRQTVDEALEELSKKNEADIVKDFAVFIPSRIVCKILGFPLEDYARLRNWSYHLNCAFEPFETLRSLQLHNQKAGNFFEYLNQIIESKEQNPDDGFISQLLTVNRKLAEPLSHSQIISLISIMFFAGIESSVNLFGQSVLYLVQRPDQAKLLREDESIAPRAVEELLRFVSPAQYTTRIAVEDVVIRGQRIKAGEVLIGAMVSANRDEEVFENPDELDLTRQQNPHFGFGYGLHYCIGARLAREEMSFSIPALFRRFPKIALHLQANFEWDTIILNRGLKSLPVVLNQ